MVDHVTEFYASHADNGPSVVQRSITAVRRIFIPVLALLGVLFWADFVSGETVIWFDAYFNTREANLLPSYWLTAGYLVLPLMFLVLNLTGRRYGAGYATAQVMVVWAILGALVYYFFVYLDEPMVTRPLPPVRSCMAFVVAMVSSQFVSITIFDWTRGNPWWRAPIYSALWGGIAFCAVFYPVSSFGTELPWINQMLGHMSLMTVAAFVMMLPYTALRPVIRPLPGYGGA